MTATSGAEGLRSRWAAPRPCKAGQGRHSWALLGDHDDQRLRIEGLLHDSEVFGDPRTLARATLAFVHHLRKDMADEEANLRALR